MIKKAPYQIIVNKSSQYEYQVKALTLRSNLKPESSFYIILVKSYGLFYDATMPLAHAESSFRHEICKFSF